MSTIASLGREWEALARSPALAAALQRWGQDDPTLAIFAVVGDLVEYVHCRDRHPADTDAVLAALAGKARTDDMAARTLLQLLLPGLAALARRHRWLGDPEERDQAVVATAFERIRTYPFETRPRRIAANVVLDTAQRLLAERDRQRREPPLSEGDERLEAYSPEPGEAASASEELLELLAWAHGRGHLSADAVRLIALTRVGGVAPAELVPQFGCDDYRVRRRRHRAECRLKEVARAA